MTPKKIWDKTAGYKTKSGALLYLLFELFKALFPDVLDVVEEKVIKYIIELLIITGGVDWIWRNKKEVLQWIANIFRTKQKEK
jgi:biotin synthase-related radical SAM superfamily protein